MRDLIDERKRLVDDNWTPDMGHGKPAAGKKNVNADKEVASSAMVEKERQRLEVLKRRQEKELHQVLASRPMHANVCHTCACCSSALLMHMGLSKG